MGFAINLSKISLKLYKGNIKIQNDTLKKISSSNPKKRNQDRF